MEKLVKQCDMELMKMAMLKHEEIFRQQVHDLHRLYRIQKQLMRDMTKPSAELPGCRPGQRRRQPHRELNLQLLAEEYIIQGRSEETPPSRGDELELTLAVGGDGSRRKPRQSTPPFASGCTGGSLTPSSSTDSDAGAPHHQRATVKQQPPWLVQCLSLRMASSI